MAFNGSQGSTVSDNRQPTDYMTPENSYGTGDQRPEPRPRVAKQGSISTSSRAATPAVPPVPTETILAEDETESVTEVETAVV